MEARRAQRSDQPARAVRSRRTPRPWVDRTLEVWQPRASRPLTREDARQIAEHVTGFMRILLEWEAAERASTETRDDANAEGSPGGRRSIE